MAGDWIKMRSNLHEDPRVIAISHRLKTTPLHAVGMLFRLWSWADAQSRDGHGLSVTFSFLDSLAGVTGFADAVRSVGWLEGDELCVSLPRFEEHNGQTAKTRALNRERKANQRERDVTLASRSDRDEIVTREEKRREEEEKSKARLIALQESEHIAAIYDAYPKKAGRKAAEKAIRRALHEVGFDHLLERTNAYAIARKGQDSQFTPHPATWFNQARYDDDPSTWISPNGNGLHRPSVADERNHFIGGAEIWEATSGKLAETEGTGF